MHNLTAVKKSDRSTSILLTGVTSVVDATTTKTVTVGGISIVFSIADWDFLETVWSPAPDGE